MTGFNHGLTGAVIAVTVKQPWLALPLSFASHYAADFVPHYGSELTKVFSKKFNLYVELDFVAGILMMACVAAVFPSQRYLIWGCMIVAAAPDIVWWLYRKSIKRWPEGFDRFTAWHYRINARSHTKHIYFDIAWFVLMWGILLTVKFS